MKASGFQTSPPQREPTSYLFAYIAETHFTGILPSSHVPCTQLVRGELRMCRLTHALREDGDLQLLKDFWIPQWNYMDTHRMSAEGEVVQWQTLGMYLWLMVFVLNEDDLVKVFFDATVN